MTRPPARTLFLGLIALGPGCGHRGDPLPPLRRTPPAPAELRLAQRGELMELSAKAPGASVDGIAYQSLRLEFLYTTGTGDIEKTGTRLAVDAAPGERAARTLPLPPAGTSLRAAARAIAGGEKGAKTLTLALVARPPVEAPRELQATLSEDGVALAWRGERPKALPTPAPPAVGSPGSPPMTAPVSSTGALPAKPGAAPAPAGPEPAGPAAAGPQPVTAGAVGGDDRATEAKASRRANGFLVYRRVGAAAFEAPLGDEPLEHRSFSDTGVPLGATLCYVVRAAVSTNPLIESAASNEACLDTRDISAPAQPTGLAVLPRKGGLELLWSPSREPDIAGYRVYRSAAGEPAVRLAELPAAETAHLDLTAVRGRRYAYTLTVFDQAGNEGPASEPVEASLP